MATNAELVTQLYVGYYDRAPDPEGLQYWIGRIEAGVSLADIANSFATSPEAIATYPFFSFPELVSAETFLKSVYLNLFGRAIDADGLAYYSEQLSSGTTPVGQILAQIIGNAATNEGSADQKFLANKVSVGLDWATTAANKAGFVFNDAAKNSASTVLDSVNATDASVTAAKAATADFFSAPTAVLGPLTTGLDTIVGTVANELIRADQNTLQATDSIDGGAGTDTFEYTYTGTASATVAAAQVKNVEIINVRNAAEGAVSGTKETATFTFTDVTVTGTIPVIPAPTATITIGGRTVTLTGNAGDGITAGSDVTFTAAQIAQAFGAGSSAITGISVAGSVGAYTTTSTTTNSVTFTADANGNVTNLTTSATGSATAPTFTIVDGTGSATAPDVDLTVNASNFVGATDLNSVNSVGKVIFTNVSGSQSVGLNSNGTAKVDFNQTSGTTTTVNVSGGTKAGAAITNTGVSVATATINSKGAAANTVAIDLGTGTNVTKLTVNAQSNLTATLGADYAAAGADLVVAGAAAKVDLGSAGTFKTIDATGLTAGGLTITTSSVTSSVKGGAGADVITLGGLTATGTVDLGAGNDILRGTVAPGAGATINGGDGIDTVASNLVNVGNAAKFVNFEVLELNGSLDLALLTGTTIQKLSLAGTSGGTFNNVAAGIGLEVSGDNSAATTTINLANATGTADSFAVTFAGTAGSTATATSPDAISAGKVGLSGIEAISLASAGTGFVANSVELTGLADLKTLTITGDKALTLTFDGNIGTNGTTTGLSSVDASAATGAVDIDLTSGGTVSPATAGLTVKTGTGNDTITLSTKATVDAGAGNDKIVSSAAGGTFTGGAGNDTFDLKLAVATGVTEATSVLSTITDAAAGDKIDFTATTFAATKVALGTGITTLEDALDAAVTTASQATWFQYGGNTYIVADSNGSAGFNAGDTVVKLLGLVDLATATFAANELTLA